MGGSCIWDAVAQTMVGLSGGSHEDRIAAVWVTLGGLAPDWRIRRTERNTLGKLDGIVHALGNPLQNLQPPEICEPEMELFQLGGVLGMKFGCEMRVIGVHFSDTVFT